MRNRTVQPIRISSQSRSRTNVTWTPSRRPTHRTSCPTDPNPPMVPDSTTRLKTRTRLQEAPPPPSNQAGVTLAAAADQTAPVADTPAGTAIAAAAAGDHSAESSSGGFFSAAIGSGPNAATIQVGCHSGSGTFNKNYLTSAFAPPLKP
jgi:hypothetical protein